MFVRIWMFRPRSGFEREFEAIYGNTGEWTRLFELGDGYLGTELHRVADEPPEYRTIDRWESRAAWETFRERYKAPYESLDERAARVTDLEQLIAETETPPRDE